MTEAGISPRARAILAAVEQEVAARQQAPSEAPARPLRIDAMLMAVLELAVAGHTRDEVRALIGPSEDALDAVFGDRARLHRP